MFNPTKEKSSLSLSIPASRVIITIKKEGRKYSQETRDSKTGEFLHRAKLTKKEAINWIFNGLDK